jgi:ParB family transcriptional regulator, chromosome partitioning protein
MINTSAPSAVPDTLVVEQIEISRIDVGPRLRGLDQNWVLALAESIAAQGLNTPIAVVPNGNRYRLVFGWHRLAAMAHLGRTEINAITSASVEDGLREIAENLVRRELSVLDHAVHVASWREIYSVQHPIKRGRKSKSEAEEALSVSFALNFSEAAQQAMGISRRAVFRLLQISSIEPGVRARIALHPIADNGTELLLLSAETPARQAQIAGLLLGTDAPVPTNVSEAIAKLDGVAPDAPLAPHARLAEAFSRLKPDAQEQFFEMHADAIERWRASRKAVR